MRARTSSRERCGCRCRSSRCLAGTALAFVAFACLATREAATQLFSGTVQNMVAWFALLSAGGLLAYGLFVKAPLFDRYLSQLAFPVAVLLARSCLVSRCHHSPHPCSRTDGPLRQHWQGWQGWAGCRVATVVLVLLIGAVTAALTLNADSYDGARWRAGDLAVQAGFAPSVVDAGFEWVGTHTSEDANRALQVLPGPDYEAWYDKLYRRFPGLRFRDRLAVAATRPEAAADNDLRRARLCCPRTPVDLFRAATRL